MHNTVDKVTNKKKLTPFLPTRSLECSGGNQILTTIQILTQISQVAGMMAVLRGRADPARATWPPAHDKADQIDCSFSPCSNSFPLILKLKMKILPLTLLSSKPLCLVFSVLAPWPSFLLRASQPTSNTLPSLLYLLNLQSPVRPLNCHFVLKAFPDGNSNEETFSPKIYVCYRGFTMNKAKRKSQLSFSKSPNSQVSPKFSSNILPKKSFVNSLTLQKVRFLKSSD